MQDKNAGENEVQVVIFRLQQEEFGIEINRVREIIRMVDITRIPEAPGFIVGVVNLHGQVIAVIDLVQQLSLVKDSPTPSKSARIIVVETGKTLVGMVVDEVPEVLKIPQSNISPPPEVIQMKIKTDYISGIGKLGERLIVMLNLTKVLDTHALKEG